MLTCVTRHANHPRCKSCPKALNSPDTSLYLFVCLGNGTVVLRPGFCNCLCNVGETSETPVVAHMGFCERMDSMLNRTGLV